MTSSTCGYKESRVFFPASIPSSMRLTVWLQGAECDVQRWRSQWHWKLSSRARGQTGSCSAFSALWSCRQRKCGRSNSRWRSSGQLESQGASKLRAHETLVLLWAVLWAMLWCCWCCCRCALCCVLWTMCFVLCAVCARCCVLCTLCLLCAVCCAAADDVCAAAAVLCCTAAVPMTLSYREVTKSVE
jgi:hypothetical protein